MAFLIPSLVRPQIQSFQRTTKAPGPVLAPFTSIGIEPEQPERALQLSPPVRTTQVAKLAGWANDGFQFQHSATLKSSAPASVQNAASQADFPFGSPDVPANRLYSQQNAAPMSAPLTTP